MALVKPSDENDPDTAKLWTIKTTMQASDTPPPYNPHGMHSGMFCPEADNIKATAEKVRYAPIESSRALHMHTRKFIAYDTNHITYMSVQFATLVTSN